MMREITRNTVFVSTGGGTLDFVSEDGELLMSVAVPPGRVRATRYLDLVPEGARIEVGEGLVAFQPPHRIGVQPYGEGSHDSGANPDFRPTSASRLEREMRVTLNRMRAATDRVEARERALARVERIPKARDPEPVDVVDPVEPGPVEPEPKAKSSE